MREFIWAVFAVAVASELQLQATSFVCAGYDSELCSTVTECSKDVSGYCSTTITSSVFVSTTEVLPTTEVTITAPTSSVFYEGQTPSPPPSSPSPPTSCSSSSSSSTSPPSPSPPPPPVSSASSPSTDPYYNGPPSSSTLDGPCTIWHGPPPALTAFTSFGPKTSHTRCETLSWIGSTHSNSASTNPAPSGTPVPPGTPVTPKTISTVTTNPIYSVSTPDATSATSPNNAFAGMGDRIEMSAMGLLTVMLWPFFYL